MGEAETVVRVEDLAKKYTVRHKGDADTLRDALRGLLRRRPGGGNSTEEFWALGGVSFEVRRGEVLGVIGRNGAGKSTVLKILSRITEPTAGRVEIAGRVASLLEVGTGFHPELTGRENIFLNGAILGMGRSEIRRKFDQIVEFSGVERFLDTPVKRYSSGMGVRLGFAVAAHLEPEILIIDEVLAVGDAEFQAKCLGKMQEVATGQGRTVIFVSHNMNAVHRLCGRCLFLEKGRKAFEGPTAEAVRLYMASNAGRAASYRAEPDEALPGQILEVEVCDADGGGPVAAADLDSARPFALEITARLSAPAPAGYLTVSLRDPYGTPVLFTDLRDTAPAGLPGGVSRHRVEFPGWLLAAGEYALTAGLAMPGRGLLDAARDCVTLTLRDVDSLRGERMGYIGARLAWSRVGGGEGRR